MSTHSVNPQITDAVAQANAMVLGDGPALAIGTTHQSTAHAIALATHNAVAHQQNLNVMMTATVARAIGVLQCEPEG